MKRKIFYRPWVGLILFLLSSLFAIAPWVRPVKATIPQATATARVNQYQQQRNQIQPDSYDLGRHPINSAKEDHWRNILWTTALLEPEDPYVTTAIVSILDLATRSGLSPAQSNTVKSALQVSTQLYLKDPDRNAVLGQQFQAILSRSPNPEWTAMALSALVQAGLPQDQVDAWQQQLSQRFPNWQRNVHLYSILRQLAEQRQPSPLPPIQDLLNWQVAPGQLQAYVLCRPDRGLLCPMILKDRQGRFVRRQGGELWTVPLLLRSIHSLNSTFTRGQTPQGLFRIEGVVPQPDLDYFRAYGQFDLVKLFVPFESGVKAFSPGRSGPFKGTVADYLNLWPTSWRRYFPIQESYWAGKAGRNYFRIHGTGDAPSLFANNQRYPASAGWNPSIGCLSAIELYDDQGRLMQADMPDILSTLVSLGGRNFVGYLAVVDIPGPPGQAISLAEVASLVGDR